MQLTIARDSLVALLGAAASASAPKSPMTGYTMAAMTAADSSLTVRGTDGFVGVVASRSAAVKAPGNAAVDARSTFELVKSLPAGDVTLKLTATHLEFRAGKATRFKVRTLDVSEAPVHPDLVDAKAVCAVTSGELLVALKAGSYARDHDETSQRSQVLLDATADVLRIISANSAAMAVSQVKATCDVRELVMSSRGIGELVKLCDSAAADITISSAGPVAVFATDGCTLWARQRDDKALPYARLLESCKGKHTVRVAHEALLEAVKRVAVVAQRVKQGAEIDISLCDGQLRVSSKSGEDEASDVVECDANVECSLLLDPGRLLPAIIAARSDELTIEYTTGDSPIVLRCDAYTAIVMPLRKF